MAFKAKVRIKDTKKQGWKNLARNVKDISVSSGSRVDIGVFASQGSDLVTYASSNEFGARIPISNKMRAFLRYKGFNISNAKRFIIIPERSFLRATLDHKRRDIKDFIARKKIDFLVRSKTTKNMFNQLGLKVETYVKTYITDLKEPENHPITIAMKNNSSNPLIASGRMRASITYRIASKRGMIT